MRRWQLEEPAPACSRAFASLLRKFEKSCSWNGIGAGRLVKGNQEEAP